MKVSAHDIKLGDFCASENGLIIGYFDYDGTEDEDTGYTVNTEEEFLGDSPIPVYLGQKYDEKLSLELSLVKNPCVFPDPYFTEYEIRGMLRQVFGQRGYIWLDLIADDPMEDISYKVRVNNVRYQRVQGRVAGVLLSLEGASQFGVGREQNITLTVGVNAPFTIYIPQNDDVHNYLLPTVKFVPNASGTWTLTNQTDRNWKTIFSGAAKGEILTFDCEKEIVTSSLSSRRYILDSFTNLHWPRLLSPKNVYTSSLAGQITFTFRPKIRAGFVAI